MNAYSQDLRNKVIELYKDGKSRLEIAELLKMCYSTLCNWIKEYNLTGKSELVKPAKEGRKRLFDDKESVLKYLEENPDANSKEIRLKCAPEVSYTCFYNSLKRMGFSYKKKNLDSSKDVKKEELNIRKWYPQ